MTLFDLRLGDCLEGMDGVADETIDLVVTSPPYNLGIAYRSYADHQERGDYLAWCHAWAAKLRRVLKREGSLFLNVGASPSNPMLPHELVLQLRDLFVVQRDASADVPRAASFFSNCARFDTEPIDPK